tara:strand:- start:120 stop:740 length:621 start_codon:yes stop_codon:yes gene_type:complete
MEIKPRFWFWKELLKVVGKYDIIYVSGPQRSGTRYATYILGHTKGFEVVTFSTPHRSRRWHKDKINEWFFEQRHKMILHCPAESHLLHKLDGKEKLVIWMDRNEKDVSESEDRIKWHPRCFEKEEKPKYLDMFPEHKEKIESFDRNYSMKTWIWNNIQKDLMTVDYIELPYETLEQTDGYLRKEQRKDFSKAQIRLTKEGIDNRVL